MWSFSVFFFHVTVQKFLLQFEEVNEFQKVIAQESSYYNKHTPLLCTYFCTRSAHQLTNLFCYCEFFIAANTSVMSMRFYIKDISLCIYHCSIHRLHSQQRFRGLEQKKEVIFKCLFCVIKQQCTFPIIVPVKCDKNEVCMAKDFMTTFSQSF